MEPLTFAVTVPVAAAKAQAAATSTATQARNLRITDSACRGPRPALLQVTPSRVTVSLPVPARAVPLASTITVTASWPLCTPHHDASGVLSGSRHRTSAPAWAQWAAASEPASERAAGWQQRTYHPGHRDDGDSSCRPGGLACHAVPLRLGGFASSSGATVRQQP
jgi:hypothetical protein